MPVCLAALAALGGCGEEETLSRAEYIRQADAICTDYSERQQQIGSPKSVEDIERVATAAKPLLEERLDKLRALAAPDAIAGDAEDFYDLVERQVPQIDELAEAAKASDEARLRRIAADTGKLTEQANAKTAAIGLKVCGQS